jgi:hypothetical protein
MGYLTCLVLCSDIAWYLVCRLRKLFHSDIASKIDPLQNKLCVKKAPPLVEPILVDSTGYSHILEQSAFGGCTDIQLSTLELDYDIFLSVSMKDLVKAMT